MRNLFSVFLWTYSHAFCDGFLKSLQRDLKHPNMLSSFARIHSHYTPFSHCKVSHVTKKKKDELMLIPYLKVLYKKEDEIARNRRFAFSLCYCYTDTLPEKDELNYHWIEKLYIWLFKDARFPYMNNYRNGSIKNIKIRYSFNLPYFAFLSYPLAQFSYDFH